VLDGVQSKATLVPGSLISQETGGITMRDFVNDHGHDENGDLKYKFHGASIAQLWLRYVRY